MHVTHGGNAMQNHAVALIGCTLPPISSIEGNDALTLVAFTSLLDFAGPRARRFFYHLQKLLNYAAHWTLSDNCTHRKTRPKPNAERH